MSGKEQTKNSEQGGVLDSVKEATKNISNEISKQTGGSQVLARGNSFGPTAARAASKSQ